MVAQRKKVMLKREQDKSFGFLKIETSIKPESRLSKSSVNLLLCSDDILHLNCCRDEEDDQG